MGKQCLTLFFWAPKSLWMVIASMKLKDAYSLEGKLWPTSVQSLSHVRLFATPWITSRQASLSITNSQEFTQTHSPSSQWCHPAISSSVVPFSSCPSIPPSIRVFSNESTLRMRWPKYWSFSLGISPSNEHPGLISFRMDWLDLLAVPMLIPWDY